MALIALEPACGYLLMIMCTAMAASLRASHLYGRGLEACRHAGEHTNVDDLEAVRDAATEAAHSLGVELLDVRWTGGVSSRSALVIVDRPGGVSVGTCASISRRFDVAWEANRAERRAFGLEVASPGPNRALMTEHDFERVAGRWVEVEYTTESGRTSVRGQVLSYADGKLVLRQSDEDSIGEAVEIRLSWLERAKVLFVIGSPKPGREGKKPLRRSRR